MSDCVSDADWLGKLERNKGSRVRRRPSRSLDYR